MASLLETSKSFKLERHSSYLLRRINSTKILAATSHLLFRISILATVVLILLFTLHYPPLLLSHSAIGSVSSAHSYNHRSLLSSSAYGGAAWEREVRRSATPHSPSGLVALFEVAAKHADPQLAVVWASSSSVRPQHRVPFLRAPSHRPLGLPLRRHQEGRQGHYAHLQPHLRPQHHRPPLPHGVRPVEVADTTLALAWMRERQESGAVELRHACWSRAWEGVWPRAAVVSRNGFVALGLVLPAATSLSLSPTTSSPSASSSVSFHKLL